MSSKKAWIWATSPGALEDEPLGHLTLHDRLRRVGTEKLGKTSMREAMLTRRSSCASSASLRCQCRATCRPAHLAGRQEDDRRAAHQARAVVQAFDRAAGVKPWK